MEASDSIAKFCTVCSNLDIQRMTHPFYPCREPISSCSTPPIEQFGTYLSLGSIDAIKRRRFLCDICRLVSDCLDDEPEDGECRITESAQFCNFRLPATIKSGDPSVTHFHLTQATVIFDATMENVFQGPALPWDLKEKYNKLSHFVLNFQIKARSCIEPANRDVSPSTEEEFLDTIGGRYVGTQVNPQLIRAWLHQCESEHGKECAPSVGLPQEIDRQPTFVIDVINSCLVDTPLQCRYVALSYVWGTAPVFKHLTDNTKDIRKTGSLQSLPIPATIRDSITLVRAIGEQYLWVDSLCIIQDDLKMQQEEIERMTAIYSKALFTIIAAAGNNANSGLPGVERGSRNRAQKILKLADCELLTAIDIRKGQSGIEDTTWGQRAWTFQERILSSRVLVFSENQVYWSCRSVSHSEERALEDVLDIDRLHLVFPQRSMGDWLYWKPLQPYEFWEFYEYLLSNYRQRRLTYETDLLNAFSGVSHILAAVQNDTFFWGLPGSMFSSGMTWFFTGDSIRNYVEVPMFQRDGSKQVVPFPSWSWAAWSATDSDNLPILHALGRNPGHAITDFYIVDQELQLVRIKERPWEDQPDESSIRALWQEKRQSHSPPTLSQYPLPRIGHLYFWTSFATTRAYKSRQFVAQSQARYVLLSVPNFIPDPDSEIVLQDFIVVAEYQSGTLRTLVLLVIEWKDGVAYRIGDTDIAEADWVRVENREWRLITLG